MSPEPLGFGAFPRTEERCGLGGSGRDTASDHSSPDPTIERIPDTYRGVDGEGTRRQAGGDLHRTGCFVALRER